VLTEQLQTALNNRITIEQAKGLLAHAGNLDMDQAFQALRSYGRAHSTRLSEIAHQLATGALDPTDVLTHQQSS
jgi:AmiR/NasT family two-component response regulator